MIGRGNCLLFFLLTLLCINSHIYGLAHADDCREAVQIYNRAVGEIALREKERLYTLALGLDCSDPEILAKILNNRADTYERQGQLEKAISGYKKAIETNPALPTPYLSLAQIYTKMNRPEEASYYSEQGFFLSNYLPSEEIVRSLSPSRAVKLLPQVTLYFGFNRSDLSEAAQLQLAALEKALKNRELLIYRFRIEGHTCSLGSSAYNQSLSNHRADVVKNWLVSRGILPDRLVTIGFGEDRPVAENTTEEGRRRNRRVNIRTIGVAMISAPVNAKSPGQKEALSILRTGERLLMLERYEEAVEKFTEAKNAFEKENFKPGIQAALKDLTLAYRFLEDWEKAEHYRRQLAQESP